MIKHEEAVKNLLDGDEVDRDLQYKYVRQQEQFAKDVARYFELESKDTFTFLESEEWNNLYNKITKGVAK